MEFPTNLNYTDTHEWALMDDEAAAIGITDYASDQLGDIVFIGLPEIGDLVAAGEAFADIESVKAVSETFSPVSGTVVEVNEALLDEPALINEAPYDAWFVKVEPVSGTVDFMDADTYREHCENETH